MALYLRPERVGFLLTAVALAAGLTVGLTASAAPASATGSLTGVPRGIAVDPGMNSAYVALSSATSTDGSVARIDLATGEVTGTISLAGQPGAIALDPDTHEVYVADFDASGISVSVINEITGVLTTTSTLPRAPDRSVTGIAVDPETDMIYVGVNVPVSGGFIGGVAVLDGQTNAFVTSVPIPCEMPITVADNPVTDTVYTSCPTADKIIVIDGAQNTVTNVISLPYGEPQDIAVNPQTNVFYVVDAVSGGTVSAFNGATNQVIGTVTAATSSSPVSIAVNPSTDTAYTFTPLPNSDDSIALINGTGTAVTATIPVTEYPFDIAVDPDTDTLLYAGDYPSTLVSLIPLLPPQITSPASTTFTVGAAGSFNATATGTPTPALTESGKLPAGVTPTSTGGLSGTPTAGTGGTYTVTITAANGVAPAASQRFTLTVHQAAAITSANHTTFAHGKRGSFTVRTTGFPVATVTESGSLPPGVKFTAAKNGTATITGTPAGSARGKTYVLQFTARNGVGKASVQRFTLRVN
jgi:DNA-binding beta-propeller fold protein YncE